MSLLKEIGAILGFVAFGGMTVLAFLTFQQARHVRRLREWAGRSPERAAVEADRVAEVAGEATIARRGGLEEPSVAAPGRMERLRGELAYRREELDRRSPVSLTILVAALVAVLVGVGIVTSGFGLLGGSSDSPSETATTPVKEKVEPVKVAVLNGTAPEVGGVGVPDVADEASGYVEDAGFKLGNVDDAPAPFPVSLIMYVEGSEADAEQLAADLEERIGATEIEAITPEVQDSAGRADLALIIGLDDQGIAS